MWKYLPITSSHCILVFLICLWHNKQSVRDTNIYLSCLGAKSITKNNRSLSSRKVTVVERSSSWWPVKLCFSWNLQAFYIKRNLCCILLFFEFCGEKTLKGSLVDKLCILRLILGSWWLKIRGKEYLGLDITSVADVPFQMCFLLEKQPNQLWVNVRTPSLQFSTQYFQNFLLL